MNSVVVVLLGFAVAIFGYRLYAKRIDSKVIKSDPKRATPATMYMDGVEFMPTS
jgi:carbon starvation protein